MPWWQAVPAALSYAGFVVLFWNSHRITRWARTAWYGGTIVVDSIVDAPRWALSPWPGRIVAVLMVVGPGLAWLGS